MREDEREEERLEEAKDEGKFASSLHLLLQKPLIENISFKIV